MKMNPAYVNRFESSAERKLFPAFEHARLDGATAFHSLNLPEHEKKQFSEADYVVVSPRGILTLEVKGGRLSCKQGIWYTKNRFGSTEQLKESPVVQAKNARLAIEQMLRKRGLDFDISKVVFGFGVMFPDVKLRDIGIELAREEVFDALDWDRRELPVWLERLYRYWVKRTGKTVRLDEHEVAGICNALRREFDKDKSLLAKVGDSWEQMISLTDQQFLVLDTILENKQVIVKGGAGTGKTIVAIKAAKALMAKGKKVLFVCRSPVLTSFIKNELKDTDVSVLKFSTLVESPHLIPAFDSLVVDEGQDMLDMESISTLDNLFKNGMTKGSWYFFMDPNNQSSLYAEMEDEAAEYLQICGVRVPLTRNCRNTRQIAIHTMIFTGGDIGKCRVVGEGLPVLEKDFDHASTEHLVELVTQQLVQWIDDEGVQPGDITLLSPLEYEQSCVQNLDRRWRRRITVINEAFGERWRSTSLPFSTIRDFKGLENKYVMLLDMGALLSRRNSLKELYVAMTRANTVLWMSIPKDGRYWFDDRRGENSILLNEYLKQEQS